MRQAYCQRYVGLLFCVVLCLLNEPVPADDAALSALEIMQRVNQRHEQYPYVYEEQSMILMDDQDHRDVRTVRRYSRIELDGTIKYLLVFDSPPELKGVALRAVRTPDGVTDSGIYLPAFSDQILSTPSAGRGGHFLGTDFSVDDLTPDLLSDYRYEREEDLVEDEVEHFVIRAWPATADVASSTGYSYRRHIIRKDNLYIVRTEYFDLHGRKFKQQSRHELKQIDQGSMWRANMVLMTDSSQRHQTLVKINQRVFSPDYVPAEIFTREWLQSRQHLLSTAGRLFADIKAVHDVAEENVE